MTLTRTQAQLEAATSVRTGYAELLGQGRRQAREVIQPPAAGRYQHSRRVLRDWFVQVYDHTVAVGLGAASEAELGAAQVEATARLVRASVRADLKPQVSFAAAAVIYQEAQVRGNRAVGRLYDELLQRADRAAVAFTPGREDATRTHILRHWYRRCFVDSVDQLVGLQQPMRAVTDAEMEHVTSCVVDGRPRRLIDENGFPLMTAHGTTPTDVDRGLAEGRVGLQPPDLSALEFDHLGGQDNKLLRAWAATPMAERRRWAEQAGLPPGDYLTASWMHLSELVRGRWAATWSAFRDPQPVAFSPGPVLGGPPAQAAAEMFNHAVELLRTEEARTASVVDVGFPRPGVGVEISRAEVPTSHRRPDPGADRGR